MNDLNEIRRDESHNREITENALKKLNGIYDFLMSCIAKENPDIIPQYIIENWRNSLYKIVNKLQSAIPNIEEKDRNNLNKTMSAMKIYNNAIMIAVQNLDELICPLDKKKLHTQLSDILTEINLILTRMIEYGEKNNIKKLENEFTKYILKMEELNNFQEIYLLSEL